MVIDELLVRIGGDAAGIEAVLKSALRNFTSTIDSINKESVDWTSIFTRLVSPGMISGFASMFAIAINQLVGFNNAVTDLSNVAAPATNTLSNSINQTTGEVYQLAETAGVSLGDATAAFNAFVKAGLDASAAQYAVIQSAGIARDTHQDLATVVGELSSLFRDWGVTTIPQVTDALTNLVNAAQKGQFSFDELVQTITSEGANLRDKTNIGVVADNLAALSTQSGMTKDDIISDFHAIAEGAANPLSDMSILVGKAGLSMTGPDGLIHAFEAVKARLDTFPESVRQDIGRGMGLTSLAVTDFEKTTIGSFDRAADAAKKIRDNLVPLVDDLAAHESDFAKLVEDWNRFSVILASLTIPSLLPGLHDVLSTIDKDLSSLQKLLSGNASETDWGGAAGAVGVGASGLAGALTGGAAGAGIGSLLGPWGTVGGGLIGAIAGFFGGTTIGATLQKSYTDILTNILGTPNTGADSINKILRNSNAGFSDSVLNRIDKSAEQSGLVDALITALGHGTNAGNTQTFNQAFNLSLPQNATSISAKDLAIYLYQQFQSGAAK